MGNGVPSGGTVCTDMKDPELIGTAAQYVPWIDEKDAPGLLALGEHCLNWRRRKTYPAFQVTPSAAMEKCTPTSARAIIVAEAYICQRRRFRTLLVMRSTVRVGDLLRSAGGDGLFAVGPGTLQINGDVIRLTHRVELPERVPWAEMTYTPPIAVTDVVLEIYAYAATGTERKEYMEMWGANGYIMPPFDEFPGGMLFDGAWVRRAFSKKILQRLKS
jgi:hypothetical protein